MLNPELHLNQRMFDETPEARPIRAGFGEGLLAAADLDRAVVGLCADLTESTHMLPFKQRYPERFIEMGVAEQNLAGVASGMAAMGKIPFITSYAMFSPGRNWEQIRTTICYNDRPVKIAGSHAGVSVGPDGGTHQAIEDIALMRVLPRMVVISPCDAIEARKATIAAAKTGEPTYIRLAREKTPVMTTDDTPFEIGTAQVFWKPVGNAKADVALIATGALLHRALRVARGLEAAGKHALVLNVSTIKPLDADAIVRAATEARAVVTVEEHQIAGGLGGAVSELLAQHRPTPIEFIGVRDLFGQSGQPDELIERYGMGEKSIAEAVHRVLLRKS